MNLYSYCCSTKEINPQSSIETLRHKAHLHQAESCESSGRWSCQFLDLRLNLQRQHLQAHQKDASRLCAIGTCSARKRLRQICPGIPRSYYHGAILSRPLFRHLSERAWGTICEEQAEIMQELPPLLPHDRHRKSSRFFQQGQCHEKKLMYLIQEPNMAI